MTKRVTSLILPIIVGLLLFLGTIRTVSASPPTNLLGAIQPSSLSALDVKLATPPLQAGGAITIETQAATGATVNFYRNNDPDNNPLRLIPRLIFSQTGTLTDDITRTVIITVANVTINPGITETIAITVLTQALDPDLGGPGGLGAVPIIVWQDVQTRSVPIHTGARFIA